MNQSREFLIDLKEIDFLIDTFSKKERMIIVSWIKKLSCCYLNPSLVKNRNEICSLLLRGMIVKKLDNAFTKMPPDGPIPKMQAYQNSGVKDELSKHKYKQSEKFKHFHEDAIIIMNKYQNFKDINWQAEFTNIFNQSSNNTTNDNLSRKSSNIIQRRDSNPRRDSNRSSNSFKHVEHFKYSETIKSKDSRIYNQMNTYRSEDSISNDQSAKFLVKPKTPMKPQLDEEDSNEDFSSLTKQTNSNHSLISQINQNYPLSKGPDNDHSIPIINLGNIQTANKAQIIAKFENKDLIENQDQDTCDNTFYPERYDLKSPRINAIDHLQLEHDSSYEIKMKQDLTNRIKEYSKTQFIHLISKLYARISNFEKIDESFFNFNLTNQEQYATTDCHKQTNQSNQYNSNYINSNFNNYQYIHHSNTNFISSNSNNQQNLEKYLSNNTIINEGSLSDRNFNATTQSKRVYNSNNNDSENINHPSIKSQIDYLYGDFKVNDDVMSENELEQSKELQNSRNFSSQNVDKDLLNNINQNSLQAKKDVILEKINQIELNLSFDQ